MTIQEKGSAPKGTHAASLEAMLEKRVHVSDRGRPEAVAKQHAQGKYTARERIALLLDPGSFLELGGLVEPERHTFDTENLVAPGDGVITGFGRIDGRAVCIASYDFTVVGDSNGNVGELKMYRLAQRALEHGTPLLFLLRRSRLRRGPRAGVAERGDLRAFGGGRRRRRVSPTAEFGAGPGPCARGAHRAFSHPARLTLRRRAFRD